MRKDDIIRSLKITLEDFRNLARTELESTVCSFTLSTHYKFSFPSHLVYPPSPPPSVVDLLNLGYATQDIGLLQSAVQPYKVSKQPYILYVSPGRFHRRVMPETERKSILGFYQVVGTHETTCLCCPPQHPYLSLTYITVIAITLTVIIDGIAGKECKSNQFHPSAPRALHLRARLQAHVVTSKFLTTIT